MRAKSHTPKIITFRASAASWYSELINDLNGKPHTHNVCLGFPSVAAGGRARSGQKILWVWVNSVCVCVCGTWWVYCGERLALLLVSLVLRRGSQLSNHRVQTTAGKDILLIDSSRSCWTFPAPVSWPFGDMSQGSQTPQMTFKRVSFVLLWWVSTIQWVSR